MVAEDPPRYPQRKKMVSGRAYHWYPGCQPERRAAEISGPHLGDELRKAFVSFKRKMGTSVTYLHLDVLTQTRRLP